MRLALIQILPLLVPLALALPTEPGTLEARDADLIGSLGAREINGELDLVNRAAEDFEERSYELDERDFEFEERDFELDERDFEGELDERDFDAELEERDFEAELDERDFGVELDERDFDAELDKRDFDAELDERDFDAELEERDFDAELEERDFELDERDFELEERDDSSHQLARRAALPGAQVTAASGPGPIKGLQYLLVNAGQKIDIDGKIGPKTKAAVIAVQKAKKLNPDGIAGPATLGALVSVVKTGSSGNVVKAVQALVGVAADGKFGPGTKAAVVAFQGKHGLAKDGVVGPATWAKLFGGGGGGTKPPPPSNGDACANVKAGVGIGDTVVAASNIRVNKCVAARVKQMVADAAKAKVTLRANSSWRDPSQQIALRKQNCGTSHYAIYQKPSSQCRPPTAIPGTSRHERGLAIDFSNCQVGTPVYKWLKNNAHKYHFKNLITGEESWHWSWDGL